MATIHSPVGAKDKVTLRTAMVFIVMALLVYAVYAAYHSDHYTSILAQTSESAHNPNAPHP